MLNVKKKHAAKKIGYYSFGNTQKKPGHKRVRGRLLNGSILFSDQHLTRFCTIGGTDDTLLFHNFNHAGGPVVANPETTLYHGN